MLRLPADLKARLFGDHGAIRVACPACGRSVCVTARQTIEGHKRYPAFTFGGVRCEGGAKPVGDDRLRAAIAEHVATLSRGAAEAREEARKATERAERSEALAARLEAALKVSAMKAAPASPPPAEEPGQTGSCPPAPSDADRLSDRALLAGSSAGGSEK